MSHALPARCLDSFWRLSHQLEALAFGLCCSASGKEGRQPKDWLQAVKNGCRGTSTERLGK